MTVMEKVPRRNLRVLLLMLFFVALAGCGMGKVRPAATTYSPPPENILEKIIRADKQRDTLEAVANIEISSEKGRYPLKVALIVKRPSFLKIEAIPLVGTPDFFLSLQGSTLKVFLPQKREFYICRATRENLALFLPVSIPLEEIAPVLMGIPPHTGPTPGIDKSPGSWEGEGALYRVDMPSGEGSIRSFWIDRTTGTLARVEVREDYRLLYTARYEEYGEAEEIPMPRKVIITPEEPTAPHVAIRYSDIRFLTTADTAQLFDLPVPAGLEPIILD